MATQHQFEELASEDSKTDFKLIISQYLKYWKWFLFTIIVAIALAYLQNRYATQIYQTTAQIKVLKDQENGFSLSGLSGSDPILSRREINLENETAILKSRKLLDSVVQSLKLGTSYYTEGKIKTIEVWKDEIPIQINWVSDMSKSSTPAFSIKFTSSTAFQVSRDEEMITGVLNDTVSFAGREFTIELNPSYGLDYDLNNTEYGFKHTSDDSNINKLKNGLQAEPISKESDILLLSYSGPNRRKNEAIIDSLISKFNQDGMRDKQLVTKRTEEFVDERLKALSSELDEVESGLVDYKRTQGAISIESVTGQLFSKESSAEQKRFELETQKAIVEDFREALIHGGDYDLLPQNLGIESSSINSLTQKYNESALLHGDLLTSSTPSNPLVINLEKKMDRLRSNMLTSINNHLKSLDISLQSYQSKEEESTSQLSTIPNKEKEERSIKRQQEVKETLYLFLLQKREEAALQYAQTAPSVKIVDYAYTRPGPISPKPDQTYIIAFALGLFIPFGILYLKFLFDSKIRGQVDIQRVLPNIPVLAEIPILKKKEKRLIQQNDQSILAEAFRVLRTNLNFYNVNRDTSEAQIVMVTSSIKGEGKTFTVMNLAHSIATTGKRVLLLGVDLRNPQTHSYLGINKNAQPGVSSFLSDYSVKIQDLIYRPDNGFENLDFILAGQIPPNPAELLLNKRFGELLKEVKPHYDYIIIDTAPTIFVSDTFLISKYADVTLYMVRAKHTDQNILKYIEGLRRDKKLNHIGIILNAVDQGSNGHYGYGYGYNYGYGYGYSEHTPAPWWKFWKK